MSRGQATETFNTATNQNATNFGNAQNAEGQAQTDIGNYQNQLAKFVSGNPYTAGGEYDKTINAGLANTSDAGSSSLKGALQSQALRTGQNSAADAATAASNAQQNTRNMSSDLASAQQQRIASEAGYNQTALGASSVPAQMESSLYGTASGAAQGNLGTAAQEAAVPSFWDEVGNSIANIPAAAAQGASGAATSARMHCWIAAELYGGWYEPRAVLVRNWLSTEFSAHWYGRLTVWLYGLTGKKVAAFLHHFPKAKGLFLPIFNAALARAKGEK